MNKGKGILKNRNVLEAGQIIALVAIFSLFSFAQTRVTTPKSKTSPVSTERPIVETAPQTPAAPKVEPSFPKRRSGRIAENETDIPFEKSILVDAKVNVGLCVTEGSVKVNGWDRNEIRVYVSGGSRAGFKVLKRNSEEKPVWLSILGFDPSTDKGTGLEPCLSGDEIELDLPRGSILKLENSDGEVSIESLFKVIVTNNDGNILMRRISNGVEARTYEGDIFLEDSSGSINLNSINGSVVAYRVEGREIGDILKARTNSGSVVLQSIGHTVVEANSISGLIKFTGSIAGGGQYMFSNTSGQILLAIPGNSSGNLQVLSQKGRFQSDIPFALENESLFYPSMQKLNCKIGEGEASLNFVTQSGSIKIKKLD